MPFCENHPNVEATVHCADCGAWLCRDCAVRFGGKTLCGLCKDIADDAKPAGPGGAAPDDAGRRLSPWERRAELGGWTASVETMKRVLFEPTDFFRTLRPDGSHATTLTYPLILGTLFGVISYIFFFIAFREFMNQIIQTLQSMPKSSSGPPPQFAQFLSQWTWLMLVQGLISVPINVLMGLYVGAGCYHLGLMIVGGNQRNFEATFRVAAYAMGSTAIFNVLPGVGPAVGGVWAIVVAIIGLRELHGTTTGKAAFAVLWPIVLGCICVIIGLAIAAALIGAAVAAKGGGGGF